MKYTEEYAKKLPSIRIVIIQSSEIYFSKLNKVPLEIKNKGVIFDKHFSDLMPPNLELIYLNEQGKLNLKCFQDELYSYDYVNVSFRYPLMRNSNGEQVFDAKEKDDDKSVDVDKIREDLYKNGFELNGEKYVRYKRSAGSAKNGSCLFVKEKLYPQLNKWTKTGLSDEEIKDAGLTSYEAYKALSLSSLIRIFNLNPNNILFVKDFKTFVKNQKVVRVHYEKEHGLVAANEECDIENNIFDGEGLLDESIFKTLNLENKGMMLLRNRFFKCCAFNTKLQAWFKHNKITSISQLNGETYAKKVEDIVLVASESCLKYFKMAKDGFCKETIKRWCDEVNGYPFGIVKTDKKTRFFDGDMVETTYQLLNTLQMKEKDIRVLTLPYIQYIDKIHNIKETPEFIRFYLEGELEENDNDYEDDSEGEIEEELLNYSSYLFKNKVCLELMKLDSNTKYTTLFKHRVYDSIISSLALKLYNGRTLIDGTYATLFGNPFEFLNYIIKIKGVAKFNENNKTSLLKEGEIYCPFFVDGVELVGSRAPHTTMGNVFVAKNVKHREFKEWFNLSKNIVVVDAINNNIQQRLSGCDYDSDSMLITDNKIIVQCAKRNYERFYVPYADYGYKVKEMEQLSKNKKENLALNLAAIDKSISKNNVGSIVNLSQLLNSHLWNRFNKNKYYKYEELYLKIATLCVLSGAEIDSSKRSFDFDTTAELNKIKKYARANGFYKEKPLFFSNVSNNKQRRLKIGEIEKKFKEGKLLNTTMDILWEYIYSESLTTSRMPTISFYELFCKDFKTEGLSHSKYLQAEAAKCELEKTREILYQNNLAKKKSTNYELEKKNFLITIRNCYDNIKININSVEKVKLLIKKLQDDSKANSLLFILLYIIMSNPSDLGYDISDLLSENRVGIPTLRRCKKGQKFMYTLFNRYNYAIDEVDMIISNIFN